MLSTSGGGGGATFDSTYRPRKRKSKPSLKSAFRGEQLSNYIKRYRDISTKLKMAKLQQSGKGGVHLFSRSLFSNYGMSSGDFNQNIYIQSGTAPFRIYNSGSLAYQNADNFGIEFQPTVMNINWYLAGALQTVYSYRIPSFTELTALYDQMQIAWVEIEWFYGTNSSSVTGVTSTGTGNGGPTGEVYGNPMMCYCKDYDDAGSLGATPVNAIAQYENMRAWQMGCDFNDRRHVIRVKPKFDIAATDSSGVASGIISFQDSRKVWLDTTNGVNVPHYGIKGTVNLVSTVQSTSPANTFILGALGFRVTYHYRFKNVK